MNSKWDAIRGNAGFFITMAVCLLVTAVCGYFLLFDGKTPSAPVPTPTVEQPAAQTGPAATPPKPQEPIALPTEESVPAVMPEAAVPVQELIADDTPVVAEAPRLIVMPVEGETVAAFSVDELVFNPTLEDWRIHDGMDIAAEEGSSVLAAASGTVLAVEQHPLMGVTVTLSHRDGYHTAYANLQQEVPVRAGDSVSAGQIIGAVGSTAAAEANQPSHLHFSVTQDGDAVDPEEFLNQ